MTAIAELAGLDAIAQAELVRRCDITAVESVEASIGAIEQLNPVLNAVVTPMYEQAIANARGGVDGTLAGVPYLVK
ncbi:MAG TPA: hypothetical protein VNB52_02470, partial [Ilumatobacteraceae bacterium]|nr:hypothetical protein [Ilumatobacteraceae bacterium]